MKKYELSKVWIQKNGNKIKHAYVAANRYGFDITSTEDVFKLLKVVDPENANTVNAEIFTKILQLLSQQLGRRFSQKLNKKVIN